MKTESQNNNFKKNTNEAKTERGGQQTKLRQAGMVGTESDHYGKYTGFPDILYLLFNADFSTPLPSLSI
jgi:hypothetical protein